MVEVIAKVTASRFFRIFAPVAGPDRPVQVEVERADHEEEDGDRLIGEAVVIDDVLALRGEAPGRPSRHEDPEPVEEGTPRRQADEHPAEPEDDRADDQVDDAHEPDGLGRADHVGEEAFVLALAHIHFISSRHAADEEAQGEDDDALAPQPGEEMTPHIEAVGRVIQVEDQGQAGRGHAAHHVEHAVEVGAPKAAEIVGESGEDHHGQPGQGHHHHALGPGQVPLPAAAEEQQPPADRGADAHAREETEGHGGLPRDHGCGQGQGHDRREEEDHLARVVTHGEQLAEGGRRRHFHHHRSQPLKEPGRRRSVRAARSCAPDVLIIRVSRTSS